MTARIRITKVGPKGYKRWVTVTIPREQALKLGDQAIASDPKQDEFAIGGRWLGKLGRQYHVLTDMKNAMSRDVELVAPPEEFAQTFKWADTVLDPSRLTQDIKELVPEFFVGGRQAGWLGSETVEQDDARVVLRLRYEAVNGCHPLVYLTCYSDQDIVDVAVSVTPSDKERREWRWNSGEIVVTFGEHFVSHDGYQFKYSPITRRFSHTMRNREVGEGEQILMRGRMFCFSGLAERWNARSYERWLNMVRAERTHIYAVSKDWDGQWLAFGRTPMRVLDNFDYTGWRPLNLNTGDTGDQEPFGSVKGYRAVTEHDPEWIHYALLSSEALAKRPIHRREPSGDRIKSEDYPRAKTWNQVEDWRNGEMIGAKPKTWYPGSVSGYSGIDDQHHVLNLELAAYALSGEYWLEDLLRDSIEMDRLQVTGGPGSPYWQNGRVGAARASGRLYRTWAHMLSVMPEDAAERIYERAVQRMRGFDPDGNGVGGEFERDSLSHDKPVKVAQVFTDPRQLTDDGTWRGNPVPCFVSWQESLFANGCWAMSKQAISTDARVDWADLALMVAETLVMHAFDDSLKPYAAVRWLGGDAISQDRYGQPGWTKPYEGISLSWLLCAVPIALESTDPEARQRAADILVEHRPDGPIDARDAEWLAL